MVDEPTTTASTQQVEHDDWPAWCERITTALAGARLDLSFTDDALGEVSLAVDMPFISFEHDQLGSAVALTLRYGDGVVPIRYVVAEPRVIREEHGADAKVARITIDDSTRRRTSVAIT